MSWQLVVDYLFVFSVIIIWFMLGYQFILFLLGFLYGYRAQRQRRALETAEIELPAISLMIPAHNEALVITATLEGMLALRPGQLALGRQAALPFFPGDATHLRRAGLAGHFEARLQNARAIGCAARHINGQAHALAHHRECLLREGQ